MNKPMACRFSFPFFRLLGCCLLVVSSVAFANSAQHFSSEYQEVSWTDLMPKDDLEALLNPPEYISNIADGSAQDKLEILPELGKTDLNAPQDRYQQALESTRVIDTFNDKKVRFPGFIVPLQNGEQQQITEFFIVPYFGACLHLPPPPPNQMVHVKYPKGIQLQDLYTPFWFEGTLSVQTNSNDLGTSAYAMKLNNAFIYEEE